MKFFDENKEKGNTILTALIALAVSGTIFTISSQKVNSVDESQKAMVARITHADLQKKLDTICSNLFVVRNSYNYNQGVAKNRLNQCVNGSGNCLAQQFEASLFNESGTLRYTGAQSCPGIYSYYGAALTEGADKNVCINIANPNFTLPNTPLGKQAYFAVSSNIEPSCLGGAASCLSPNNIRVECSVMSLRGPAKGKTLTSTFNIAGFSCPVGQVVRGITTAGQFSCGPMIATIGLRGDRGAVGSQGNAGANGNNGVRYTYRRNKNHGCFAKGVKILTSKGEKNIEDILSTDLVWNPTAKTYQTVKKLVIGPENKPLISVKAGRFKMDVTNSHPMNTPYGVVQAQYLKQGDPILTVNGIEIVTKAEKKFSVDPPDVYNIQLNGDQNFDSHYVVANSMVTGDLYIQLEIGKTSQEKFVARDLGRTFVDEVIHEME